MFAPTGSRNVVLNRRFQCMYEIQVVRAGQIELECCVDLRV